jgi:hypothetical protein
VTGVQTCALPISSAQTSSAAAVINAVKMSVFIGLTFHNQTKIVFFHLLQVNHFFAATFCPVSGAVTGEKMPCDDTPKVSMD